MVSGLIDVLSGMSFKARLCLGGIFISISVLRQVYFEKIWIWGYAIGAFIIIVPSFFEDEFVEYDEKKAEKISSSVFYFNSQNVIDFLERLLHFSHKGFEAEKIRLITEPLSEMALGAKKVHHFFITGHENESSLAIDLTKTEHDYFCIRISSSEEIIQLAREIKPDVPPATQASEKPAVGPLIDDLEKMGFYEDTKDELVNIVKQEAIETGYIFGWESANRDFMADAEEIAEGGVTELFNAFEPFLNQRQIHLPQVSEKFNDSKYSVIINDYEYKIWEAFELKSVNLWDLSTNRALGIINKILQDQGVKEQAYKLYGGNDQRIIFLTEEQFVVINASPLLAPTEKPHAAALT